MCERCELSFPLNISRHLTFQTGPVALFHRRFSVKKNPLIFPPSHVFLKSDSADIANDSLNQAGILRLCSSNCQWSQSLIFSASSVTSLWSIRSYLPIRSVCASEFLSVSLIFPDRPRPSSRPDQGDWGVSVPFPEALCIRVCLCRAGNPSGHSLPFLQHIQQ